MRFLALCMMLIAGFARAEDLVNPEDLQLQITVEQGAATPFVGEMVLLTIQGTFRRAILREQLLQPDLAGFSWMQLGTDVWFEEMQDGLPVKVFRRRMALFPERSGTLEIGAFTHHLTLLGHHNKWFEHDITSEPVAVEVLPKPETDGWWLPVKRLRVADDWSNSPSQLGAGEGVLRTIRVEALGISPDLLPPMPDLHSPSALIFPHPEKRLVDLSPQGPVAYAFWRWTIMPRNPPSAIIEPIEIAFFDTVSRLHRTVIVSPQRVALRDADLPVAAADADLPGEARQGVVIGSAALAFLIGLAGLLHGRGLISGPAIAERLGLDRDRRELSRAARAGDPAAMWRAATRLSCRHDLGKAGRQGLTELEQSLFGQDAPTPDLRALRKSLLRNLVARP